MTDFDGVGKFQLYAAFNSFAGNVAVAFDVDSVAQRVFFAVARTTDIDAFGNISGVGIGLLIDLVQLCTVNSISAVSCKRSFGNFGDFVTAVVQTVFSQGYGRLCCTVGDGQTAAVQLAVACGYFGRIQPCTCQLAAADGYFIKLDVV